MPEPKLPTEHLYLERLMTLRSLVGGQIFCRTRGYISTFKKQKLNILDELRKVFMGNPTIPYLRPEQLLGGIQGFMQEVYCRRAFLRTDMKNKVFD